MESVLQMFTDRSFVHSFYKSVGMHQRAAHTNLFVYHLAHRGQYSFSSVFANTTEDLGKFHISVMLSAHDVISRHAVAVSQLPGRSGVAR